MIEVNYMVSHYIQDKVSCERYEWWYKRVAG